MDKTYLNEDFSLAQEEVRQLKARGYQNEDILPLPLEKRGSTAGNFFTLWMGSVHNIPNYAAVGGFFLLGLSPLAIMLSIVIASLLVAVFFTNNGRAGSKYGIPFSMHLRSVYGDVGSKLPGFLRGVVSAIAWFGLQNYTGSLALTAIIARIWPGFLGIGGGAEILGISIPGLISFTIFWIANVAIGFGGGQILNKFTAILSPLIYVVFGGMTIWALKVGGGLGNILGYVAAGAQNINPLMASIMIIASILSVWAAPGISIADFTRDAKSTDAQIKGQYGSFLVSYIVFAFASVVILAGGSIYYGGHATDIVSQIIDQWDSIPAIIMSSLVLLLTTISTNATGNVIPAANQLVALFPKQLDYRKGVLIASIISFVILPWNLGQNIEVFLNLIGAILGPVAGVMIAHYFLINNQRIDIDQLYFAQGQSSIYRGTNVQAYIATLVAVLVTLLGNWINVLAWISSVGWIAGFVSAFIIYTLLVKFARKPVVGVLPAESKSE